MVTAEALQLLADRPTAEIRPAGDDHAGGLTARVGVDDPDRSGRLGLGGSHGFLLVNKNAQSRGISPTGPEACVFWANFAFTSELNERIPPT